MRILAVSLLTLAFVAGCGGGGGSGSGSSSSSSSSGGTTPGPTPAQTTQASNAKVRVTASSAAATNVRLDWDDTTNEATGYTVEQLSGTTWTVVATVPRPTGTATTASWTGTVTLPATLRVRATFVGYSVTLSSALAQQQLTAQLPATAPTITLAQTDPVHDRVGVTIANPTGTLVNYQVDGAIVNATPAGAALAPTIDAGALTAGAHTIGVLFRISDDNSFLALRTVQVRSPDITFSSIGFFGLTNGGTATIGASAQSDFGVQQVEAFIDGASIGVVMQGTGFQFQFDTVALGSGGHNLLLVATDGNGTRGQKAQGFTVTLPPVLTLTSPFDGALANGTLVVGGTMATDKTPATLRLTGTLDGTQVIDTTATPFAVNVPLAGVAPGRHQLVLTLSDGTATINRSLAIVVTSSAPLVYTPFGRFGGADAVQAVSDSPAEVIYARHPGENYEYRVYSSTAERQLTVPAFAQYLAVYNMRLSHGHAFGFVREAANGTGHFIHWTPDGLPHDVTTLPGNVADEGWIHAMQWPWLLVGNSSGTSAQRMRFYNADTRMMLTPPLADMYAGKLNLRFTGRNNFYLSPGGIVLYYSTPGGIRRWTQQTDVDELIPLTSGRIVPQTDGIRTAWQEQNVSNGHSGLVLTRQLESNGVQSDVTQFIDETAFANDQWHLANGLLAWREVGASAGAIKLDDGTTTITLSNRLSSRLYGLGSNFAVYSDDGKLYSGKITGTPQLLLDSTPDTLWISGNTVFFTIGISSTYYAVQVN